MIIESTIQFIYLCATEKSWQISHQLIHQLDLQWFESMLEIAETSTSIS